MRHNPEFDFKLISISVNQDKYAVIKDGSASTASKKSTEEDLDSFSNKSEKDTKKA